MPETLEPKKRPERVLVKPVKDSRLESLLCLWETRKAAADEADAAYKELKASIFAELLLAVPNEEDQPTKAYDIPGSGMYPPLSYSFKTQSYMSAPLLREHLPQVYDTWKQTKEFWELRRGKG